MRPFLERLKRRSDPATATGRWTYAESVESAVTHDECERLAELAHDATVLEIGSYLGRSTIAMASTAKVVHAVDPHDGCPFGSPGTLDAFLGNLESFGVRDNVVVHVARSNDLAPVLRPATFDLVFIDAMHQRPDVDFDLAVAARCLVPGGTIAFHDYGLDGVMVGETWHPFGVTEAVDEFVALARLDAPDVVDTLAVVLTPLTDGEQERRSAWLAALDRLPLEGRTDPPYKP